MLNASYIFFPIYKLLAHIVFPLFLGNKIDNNLRGPLLVILGNVNGRKTT